LLGKKGYVVVVVVFGANGLLHAHNKWGNDVKNCGTNFESCNVFFPRKPALAPNDVCVFKS